MPGSTICGWSRVIAVRTDGGVEADQVAPLVLDHAGRATGGLLRRALWVMPGSAVRSLGTMRVRRRHSSGAWAFHSTAAGVVVAVDAYRLPDLRAHGVVSTGAADGHHLQYFGKNPNGYCGTGLACPVGVSQAE